jgi:hypothetical protein
LKVCLYNAAPFERKFLRLSYRWQCLGNIVWRHWSVLSCIPRVVSLISLWLCVLMVRRQWWGLRCYLKKNRFRKIPSQIKSKGSTLQLPERLLPCGGVSPVGVNIRHWIEGWMVSLILPSFYHVRKCPPHPFDMRVDGPRASGMNAVVKRFFPSMPGIELLFSGNSALATWPRADSFNHWRSIFQIWP